MTVLLDDLNPEQARAVTYTGPSLLVAAGPGSGKTRVVTRRIAYRILECDIAPGRVLGVTFTNRAAREMGSRVQMLVDGDAHVPIGTLHWMCAGILRRHIGALGLRADFRLLQPWEARRLMQTQVSDGREGTTASVSLLVDAVSGLKSGTAIELLAERAGMTAERLSHLADVYDRNLRRNNLLDIDDLPFLAARILREHPAIRAVCRAAIDELLVDEYQDTNVVQQELVELLAPPAGTVVVVGDEDQAIYGWRHADAGGFKRFVEKFPATQVVTLQRSYRHHKFVARAANALIARAEARSDRAIQTELPAGERPVCFVAADERDEAEWIANEIVRLGATDKLPWEEIAILYRINAQSRVLEDALVQRNVPYRVLSGRSFYARAHVQRVVAYLRLALNDNDATAATSLLESIPGMGPGRMTALQTWTEAHEVSLVTALSCAGEISRIPHKVRLALSTLGERVASVAALRKSAVGKVVEEAVKAAQCDLTEAGSWTESVVEDLDELRGLVRAHAAGRGTLRSLIDSLALDERSDSSPRGVSLMSLHSAKGLEYRAVFLPGLEEGLLPHARSAQRLQDIEEERRLCYVGMTRAKEMLWLSYAQVRMLGGHGVTGQPSRFIGEIGLQHMALKVSAAKRLKPRLATASAGDRVHHTRWGAGTVEQVEGVGQAALTTILFDSAGRRRLQLCHAPLTLHRESSADVSAG